MSRLAEASTEGGAVATLVAILMGGGVLLGMGALSIDVGQIYAERAELQNGADAAALAVAQDCADGGLCDVSPTGLADQLADGNARKDGAARVTAVCGSGVPSLSACADSGPFLTKCLDKPIPDGAAGWIETRTATEEIGGSTLLPPAFARALTGNSGYDGAGVAACARAAWGPPKGATALAVTISLCEWTSMTNNGTTFPSPEHALYLHDTTGATHCPAGPSGADLPGGFGWLSGDGCSAEIEASGWVVEGTDPGNGVPDCKAALEANLGKTVSIPIFVQTNGLNGNNGNYLIDGFAAFELTGYRLPGVAHESILTGTHLCTPSQKCLYGRFLRALVPAAEFAEASGTDRGAMTVHLIG